MKPSAKAIKKARKSIKKKGELQLEQQDFNMCLSEQVCPKCAWLLKVVSTSDYGHEYRCSNSVCGFIQYRENNIVPAKG